MITSRPLPGDAARQNGQSLGALIARFTREDIAGLALDRVPTGFEALDRSLNGGLCSGLYVLGAVPGLGKSTLALQIAHNISRQGIPVLYFALEMNRNWIAAKALSRALFVQRQQASLTAGDLLNPTRTAAFSAETWQYIAAAREQLMEEEQNLYLYERSETMRNMDHIRQAIRDFKASHEVTGPVAAVIDYLQILSPREGALKLTDKQIVDDNVRELCDIRDREGAILLLISSLNRGSYRGQVSLESFKESGSIEYSADVIWGMQYAGMDAPDFDQDAARAASPRQLELLTLKMRYGQDGTRIPLRFFSRGSYFEERAGGPASPRREELQAEFDALPIQYHDGQRRTARPLLRR